MPTQTPRPDLRGPDDGWHRDASCAGQETALWFPPVGQTGITARQICYGCPVRLRCLEEAMQAEAHLTIRYRYGIFGGLGGQERGRLAAGDRSVLEIPTFRCGHQRTLENSTRRGDRNACHLCTEAAA